MDPERSDEDEAPRELLRAGAPFEVEPSEALARVLDQSNREAAAGRAQARELIKALEGVQRSQEFLGTALREERRKSRAFVLLLAAAPLVAAAGVWFLWRHSESLRGEVARVEKRIDDEKTARVGDAAAARDGRVAELSAFVETLRRDLDASRDALAAERKHLEDREAVLAAAEHRGESAKTELVALDQEVKSARAKAAAEAGRAALLEERLRDAKAALATTSAPTSVASPPAATPAETKSAETKPVAAAAPAGAKGDADKTRATLNALLAQSGDSVRYRFEALGGVAGRSLSDVLVVGADEQGVSVRTIQAARAEITIDAPTGSVVLRFFDGKLLVGAKQAPFFDGTYGLVVRGDPAKWKASGLAAADGD